MKNKFDHHSWGHRLSHSIANGPFYKVTLSLARKNDYKSCFVRLIHRFLMLLKGNFFFQKKKLFTSVLFPQFMLMYSYVFERGRWIFFFYFWKYWRLREVFCFSHFECLQPLEIAINIERTNFCAGFLLILYIYKNVWVPWLLLDYVDLST